MDLIINHETDDDILTDDSVTLASVGIGERRPLPLNAAFLPDC